MATYRERRPLKHLNVPQKLGFGEGGSTIPNLYDYFLQIDDYIDELKNQSGEYAPINHNHDGTYAPVSHSHATGVTQIADPTTATTEDIANKINELIAALQG